MKLISLISFFAGSFFLVIFFMRCSLPYNETGRYFSENDYVVFKSEALIVYGFFMTVFYLISMIGMIFSLRKRKKEDPAVPVKRDFC